MLALYFHWRVAILGWDGEERVWLRQDPKTLRWESVRY